MRWHLVALIVGIVLLVLGGGVAVSAAMGFALARFIYMATGIGVFIVGAASTGYGAWKWRKTRAEKPKA